ncbi:MAG: fumarylacetoacetate hydrolase family protein [Pseudomonadota bacterium]
MKLMRVGPQGQEKPAMLDGAGVIRDISDHVADINGEILGAEGLAKLASIDLSTCPEVAAGTRIGPCVGSPKNVICVGLNYTDHAIETNNPIPTEPVLFSKAVTSLCGPNDDVEKPRGSTMLDWEIELAIIIGKRAKYVSEDNALDYVAGFAVFNDVSEREFQTKRPGGQWLKGKSHETFGPLGPWMVTKDEVEDPSDLAMELKVNGKSMQKGSTKTFIFHPATVVSHISNFITLEPGDIIPTGTPPGVGAGMNPQVFLNPGDVMELEIEGLGAQKQTVVAA